MSEYWEKNSSTATSEVRSNQALGDNIFLWKICRFVKLFTPPPPRIFKAQDCSELYLHYRQSRHDMIQPSVYKAEALTLSSPETRWRTPNAKLNNPWSLTSSGNQHERHIVLIPDVVLDKLTSLFGARQQGNTCKRVTTSTSVQRFHFFLCWVNHVTPKRQLDCNRTKTSKSTQGVQGSQSKQTRALSKFTLV